MLQPAVATLEWTDASAACGDPLIRLSSRSSGDAPIDDAAPFVVTLSGAGLSDVGDSTTAAVATVVVTAALKDSNKIFSIYLNMFAFERTLL